MKDKKLKIKRLICLAEMSDGKIYNILTKEETRQVLIGIINSLESGIKLLETPVDGIRVETLSKHINEPA